MDDREELRRRADRNLEEAVGSGGGRDPRGFYRTRLAELKAGNAGAYAEAERYYWETLLPACADPDADPLAAWLEYGCRLAAWTTPGRTVEVDPSGRARDLSPPVGRDRLVIHLPASHRVRPLLVGLPAELSAPQRATYELLVRGQGG